MTVLASIDPGQLTVDAGGQATLKVRVRNRGSIVDRFDIAVVGPTAGWATVDPPALRLFPDKEDEATVTFRPPRASDPAADTYPFGIAVRAASDANDSTVEEGHVTVTPFVELGTEVVPQTSRGSRTGIHDVTVHNRGNAVAEMRVSATDPDRLMTFEIVPDRAGLRPGASATVRARVKPKETFFMGNPRRLPFTIQVDEPSAGSYQVPATMEQRAIIPGWVKVAAGLVVAAIAAIAILPPMLGLTPKPTPSQAAVASPTPVVTSTPLPATLPPPTAGPTPEITPGPPSTLVAAGDAGELNTGMGLQRICDPNQPCRQDVQDLFLRILDNLLGKADGAALVNFKSTPVGTLPVVAEWTGSFGLYSAGGQPPTQTRHAAIDLAPIVGGAPAYALVADANNVTHAFVIPPLDGKRLFDMLYKLDAVPTPPPDVNGGGFDYSLLKLREFNGTTINLIPFILATPAP